MMGRRRIEPWKFARPSETCETHVGDVPHPCGEPSKFAYPAMGGGYHAMCARHAQKHLDICVSIEAARRGMVPAHTRRP